LVTPAKATPVALARAIASRAALWRPTPSSGRDRGLLGKVASMTRDAAVGENAGSKARKAAELGIQTMSTEEWVKLPS
jgi:hypothetical protein